ncbi:hypothetical protein AVEN_119888-1 [Araneus ventricosus]|uniref:Uncharacterized protein n=1 Tax=Araneus ventricosus TaxID=182803 RepID=A0A4Y2EBA0_ARAVE|nr:hypothetical protein AVEN_119888-1 [Araneus ventricosus]
MVGWWGKWPHKMGKSISCRFHPKRPGFEGGRRKSRLGIKELSDSCGCGNLGNPLHYATSCLFTTSYHLTKPSADLEPLWWKRVMNNNNSRARISKLIHFIAENETLFFPQDGANN